MNKQYLSNDQFTTWLKSYFLTISFDIQLDILFMDFCKLRLNHFRAERATTGRSLPGWVLNMSCS